MKLLRYCFVILGLLIITRLAIASEYLPQQKPSKVIKFYPKTIKLPLRTLSNESYIEIDAFYSNRLVLEDDRELNKLIDANDNHEIYGLSEILYAKNNNYKEGQSLFVYGNRQKLVDEKSKHWCGLGLFATGFAGYSYDVEAIVRVEKIVGNLVELKIISLFAPVRLGDVLFINNQDPTPDKLEPYFLSSPLTAYPLHYADKDIAIGQFSDLLINKGQRDGIRPGAVFNIYQSGKYADNYIDLGEFIVYNVFENISEGIVLFSNKELIVDKINFEAKIESGN